MHSKNFLELPIEVIDYVFSFLEIHNGKNIRVSEVCQLFYTVLHNRIQRRLRYRNIILYYRHNYIDLSVVKKVLKRNYPEISLCVKLTTTKNIELFRKSYKNCNIYKSYISFIDKELSHTYYDAHYFSCNEHTITDKKRKKLVGRIYIETFCHNFVLHSYNDNPCYSKYEYYFDQPKKGWILKEELWRKYGNPCRENNKKTRVVYD